MQMVRAREGGEKIVISTPEKWGNLLLVNKTFGLSSDYNPPNLVIPDIPFTYTKDVSRMKMREEAARAAEDLFAAGEEAGVKLFAVSAFRPCQRQESIYRRKVRQAGKMEADKFSAPPGHSEHQTGLALDITGPGVGYNLIQDFHETEEGKWIKENAADFGFIIRYPEGKEYITGYQYEPWHIRYVGDIHAWIITKFGITLEEYIDIINYFEGGNIFSS